jgi:hypothetical protein
MTAYTAFAHDSAGHPGPDACAPDGITVEDATGREVAGRNLGWPSGTFAPGFADETLGRMGFRRAGPWEWLGWDWRAPLVTAGEIVVSYPDIAGDGATSFEAVPHYQDETGWHRKHDVYGGPHDEPPQETGEPS